MKLYVGITDEDWFDFLRARPDIDEVDFWQPGGGRDFRVLEPGEPFLFKLHAPRNYIVGGGFFATFSRLPSRIAWDTFGPKNGAATFSDMRRRIEKYRRAQPDPHAEYTIGCVILTAPFFLREADWIEVPPGWSREIVQGKSYRMDEAPGRDLWDRVRLKLPGGEVSRVAEVPGPVYGRPVLVPQRLGQGAFRVLVTDTYGRQCAVTGEKALPVLQAAHIRPVSEGGVHRVDNGLLLRSDVHTLFDRGYLTVTPDYRIRASARLKKDFDDGENYVKLAAGSLTLPTRAESRPAREFLEWHADTVFLG